MHGLKVAESLTLPLDAVTQTFGCIGRKGAGKTYLAGVLAEQMIAARAQVIVLDPVGNWFGLRIGADGKSKGKDIFVIGGEHGDVPISVDAGAKLAQVFVGKGVSAVLDISGFRQNERKRFAADFAEEFFHLKKTQRSAVHLFIEEAQLFIPQRCGPEEARMLGAYENIVRLGRNYGIGATLISQRPQSVNKEVLSQVECLCVLQVNGTHERKALDEWVQEAGADRKLVNELPGLARGEGYVWSPSWLRVFERVRFAKKTTFDASATPEVGKAAEAARLSAVDVEMLRSDLKEIVAKAEQDDPKTLKRRIAELEKAQRVSTPQPDPAIIASLQGRIGELESYSQSLAQQIDKFRSLGNRLLEIAETLKGTALIPQPVSRPVPPRMAVIPMSRPVRPMRQPSSGPGAPMAKACRSVLAALVQHGQCSKSRIAALTGYAVNGGGFNNALGECRTKGWLIGSDLMEITEDGAIAVGQVQPLPTGDELIQMWNGKLGKAEREILAALVKHGELQKETIAELTNYTASGGGFNNAIGRLRTLELVEGKGMLRLTPDFAEAVNQ